MVFCKEMITVIYYTSNREKSDFEAKIRADLLKKINGQPLISVSQKPIDNFGQNICVGDVGISDANIYQQLLIGCEEAKTDLIVTAESDCLYPAKGYFNFIPENIDYAYRNTNLFIWYSYRKAFKAKKYSLCAQISGRKYLIKALKRRLSRSKIKSWTTEPPTLHDIFWRGQGFSLFRSKQAVINIKTGYGLRNITGTYGPRVYDLPSWGTYQEIKERVY